jgi:hypothetical protein
MWEYLIEKTGNAYAIKGSTTEFRDRLNELGEQGWELVCLDALGNFFFKRPKKLKPA